MRKTFSLTLLLLWAVTTEVLSQVAVGVSRNPVAGAILELASADKALILPSITTSQRNNLATAGLIAFNETTNTIEFCCAGGQWKTLSKNGAAAVNVAKVTTSTHAQSSGTKISDNASSTAWSKESVLELESNSRALYLPVVSTAITAKKGMVCFRMDAGSTGKLYFSEDGTNWANR